MRELVDKVAAGLWSRAMTLHVCARTYVNEYELLQEPMILDRVAKKHEALHPSTQNKMRPEWRPTTRTGKPSTETSKLPEKQDSTKRTVTCYNCNKKEHISRDCQEEKRARCSHYNGMGHYTKNYTAPVPTSKYKVQAI